MKKAGRILLHTPEGSAASAERSASCAPWPGVQTRERGPFQRWGALHIIMMQIAPPLSSTLSTYARVAHHGAHGVAAAHARHHGLHRLDVVVEPTREESCINCQGLKDTGRQLLTESRWPTSGSDMSDSIMGRIDSII